MTGALGLLLGLLAPESEPLPADSVTWLAPAECPDRDGLLAAIATRRSRPLVPGPTRIVGRTTLAAPRRYRLELELDVRGRRDERVLIAHTCSALVDAAALVIALAIDGEPSAAPEPVPEPAPAPATSEPPVPAATATPTPVTPPLDTRVATPVPSPPPVPITPPRRRPGGFLRLHGLAEVGALPGLTGGAGLAGGLLWRWFRLELTATWLAPRGVERHQVRLRTGLFAVGALGCVRVGAWRLVEVPVCLGLEAGGLPGVAESASGRATAVGRWFAGTASVGAAVRVHPRVALWAALQGLVALQRGTFVVREPGPERTVFDPGFGSGRLAVGVELRFGEPR